MTTKQMTFGLMIDRSMNYGTDTLTVTVMCKHQDEAHPINGRSEPLSDWDGAPKSHVGLSIGNVHIRAWVFDHAEPHIAGFEKVEVGGSALDQRELEGLLKTVKRANRGIAKAEAQCQEIGTRLTIAAAVKGLADALGCTWFAVPERDAYSMYSDVDWHFLKISDAMANATLLADAMIADAKARARAKAA